MELIVAARDGVGREECVCSMVKHSRSELAHQRFCLEVQIPHHGVTMPSTQHANGVVVDTAA
jgi:hypothetical protein